MPEIKETVPKYAGPIGYLAGGTDLEEVMLLDNGALHTVYHDPKTKRIAAGVFVEDFNPLTDKIYVYGRAGAAARTAGTKIKMSGEISLVGPAGGMTDFANSLSGRKCRTVQKWIGLLTFANATVDADELYARCVALYGEINK